jgi:hypothetical protein
MSFHLSSLSLSLLTFTQHQRKIGAQGINCHPPTKQANAAMRLTNLISLLLPCQQLISKTNFALLPIFPILPSSYQDVNN